MVTRMRVLPGLLGLLLFGAALAVSPNRTSGAQVASARGSHTIPNPAAFYCTELGFTYETVATENGQQGVCHFTDGQTCDAWDFFSGSCGQERNYCASQGYSTKVASDGKNSFSPEYALCVGKSGRPVGPATELMKLETELKSPGCESGASGAAGPEAEESQPVETLPPITAEQAAALPAAFDWRDYQGGDWMTPVKDQGSCGSCWAFAAVGASEAANNIGAGNPDMDLDLSEEYLVSDCAPSTGTCCGGGGSSALGFIRQYGIPDEGCLPYASGSGCSCFGSGTCTNCNFSTDGQCANRTCSDRCSDWSDRLTRIDSFYFVSPEIPSIKQALVENGPLVASLMMSGGFNDQGIYVCEPYSGANHVVVLVGYDDAGGYWIVKNSWGSSWNGNGYFKVGFGVCNIELGVNTPLKNSPYLPDSFGKFSPADWMDSLATSNLDLYWMPSYRASSFEYCLDTSDNDQCDTGWADAGLGLTIRLASLPANTDYVWQVRAKNNAGTVEADDNRWWHFSTSPIETWLDLQVDNVTYRPANPTTDEPIEIDIQVENPGTQGTPDASSIGLFINRKPQGCGEKTDFELYLPYLEPGEPQTLTYPLPGFTVPGTYQLWVYVDTYCEVHESDEANNLFGPVPITVQGGQPDLVVQSIKWIQDMPGLDQPVTFTVRVKNQGQYPVPVGQEALLDIYLEHQPGGCGDHSQAIHQVAVPPLRAGDIGDLVFNYPGFSQPGAHQVWAAIDTDCQVAETDEANNTLGPVEVDVLKYLIFKDGFESGDTSAWSSCRRAGGDLAVKPSAALSGNYGLAVRLDNKAPRYCTAIHPGAEAQYQARFYLDVNLLRMAAGDSFEVFQALQGGRPVVKVELRRASDLYQLRIGALEDGKSWRFGRWISIEDRPQEMEFFWRAATRPDRKNGHLSMWIDGARLTHITNLDNHNWRLDRVRLGALEGIDKGTHGTFFLDDFVSRRDNYAITP